MINYLKASNFYSIGEEIILDFRAKNGSISSPELYLDAPFGKKVTKVAFIGGANASGKTNVLRIIAFLNYILTDRRDGSDDSLPYLKFLTMSEAPTVLEVDFSIKESTYTLNLVLDANKIISEELSATTLVKERTSRSHVFSRTWNEKKQKYDVKISDLLPTVKQISNLDGIVNSPINRLNSFVFFMLPYDTAEGLLSQVANFWSRFSTNVTWTSSAEAYAPISALAERASKVILSNQRINEFISKFLRKIDIGYNQIFEDTPKDLNGEKIYGIEHIYRNKKFRLDTKLESTGTNRILFILTIAAEILTAEQGGVVVIDEADAFLHPDIYEKFVELFMSPETNRNNTQLILSSHNYTTLNFLDKQQIFLTERDEDGQTDVWRLDEVQGVRADDNFYAKYMSGTYGAVPREK